MGGSSAAPPPPPNNNMVDLAMLAMQADAGTEALKRQNALMLAKAYAPVEVRQTDMYGPSGALNKMGQLSAINAYKSKELEKMTNPEAAKMREQLMQEQSQSMDPNFWKNQMGEWSQKMGM